jgi:hypothetical protein
MRRPTLGVVTASTSESLEHRGLHVSAAAAIVAGLIALIAILNTDVGARWSAENMAIILAPPLVFGALLLLARRTSITAGRAWSLVSKALLSITRALFGCSLLFVPVGLFGEWMDSGIG